MVLPLVPVLWGLGGASVAAAVMSYFDEPETVYNIPENADPAIIEAIKGTRPDHSGTVGEGLSDIGDGLKYVAIAAALVYFYSKKG